VVVALRVLSVWPLRQPGWVSTVGDGVVVGSVGNHAENHIREYSVWRTWFARKMSRQEPATRVQLKRTRAAREHHECGERDKQEE